jgi:hypothetical protein
MYWIGSDYSILRHASGDFKRLGNQIFVFMIGGATRSEVCCLPQNINLHSSRSYMFIPFLTFNGPVVLSLTFFVFLFS